MKDLINSVITLDDDKKYTVVEKIDLYGKDYLYLVSKEGENVKINFGIYVEKDGEGYIDLVQDKPTMEKLLRAYYVKNKKLVDALKEKMEEMAKKTPPKE